jgi:uncharacterized protein YndB with AHSA1/START domain
MTEAVRTDPIVKEVRIDAAPDTVFPFFTEPDKLTRWLADEATVDPRPGGVNHQTHRDDDGTIYSLRGEFLEVSPPTRVVFTWGFAEPSVGIRPGGSTVEVTLTADGDGTLLRLVHRDLPPETRGDHDAGWDTMLGRLADESRSG